jgi:hypothetical protein
MRIRAVRVARPTDRLAEVVAFYRDVVGLGVIGGFDDHDGYTGVMLGLPDGMVHLELTTHVDGSPGEVPSADDLLVLYCDEAERRRIEQRMATHSVRPVSSANPYWSTVGALTLADPDGRRLVIASADDA